MTARLGYLNYFDTATLVATPACGATTPETFLQSDGRNDVCLATSAASQEIKGTWGGLTYTIRQFCIYRHNLAFGDTIRLQLFSDSNYVSSIYDSTALPAYASGLFTNWGWAFSNRYFTTTGGAAVGSFKITIAAAAAFQGSRIFLGNYLEAPFNPKYGFIILPASNSKQNRSIGGSLRSYGNATWREATFDMQVQIEADRAAWYEISRYCDIVRSFIYSLYPGDGGTAERDFTLFGKFASGPAQKIADVTRYDQSVKILEL